MINYLEIRLLDLLDEVGEEKTNEIISDFSCMKNGKELNDDVEFFLKKKAILFDKQYMSSTSLIFTSDSDDELILVGYYSIAQKPFSFTEGVSRSIRKEISGHHYFVKQDLPALLLGQLGKNYSDKALCGALLKGADLINFAYKRMKSVHVALPFKLIYLECKDEEQLREFYETHGFTLHADSKGQPFKSGSKKDLLIYFAPSSILDYID